MVSFFLLQINNRIFGWHSGHLLVKLGKVVLLLYDVMDVSVDVLEGWSVTVAPYPSSYPVLSLLQFHHSPIVIEDVMIVVTRVTSVLFLLVLIPHLLISDLLEMVHIQTLVEVIQVLHAVLLVHKQMTRPSHPEVVVQLVSPELSHID